MVCFDDLLIPNPEYLISGPSNGSEQGGLMACASMEDQIVWDLVGNVETAGQLFTLDIALSKHLMAMAERIGPNRIGKYGQLQGWGRVLDDTSNK